MNSPNIQNDFVTIKQEKAAQFQPVGSDFIEKKNLEKFCGNLIFFEFYSFNFELKFFFTKKKQIPFKF